MEIEVKISKETLYVILAGILLCNSMSTVSAMKKMKIQRLDSKAIFPIFHEKQSNMPLQDYIDKANEFSDANNIYPRLGDKMRIEYDEFIAQMRFLGRIFGYKKYSGFKEGEKDQPKIISIDLSYPNLERVIKEHIKSKAENWDEIPNDTEEMLPPKEFANWDKISEEETVRFSKIASLKWLFNKIDGILARPEHVLTGEEVAWFVDALVGTDLSKTFCVEEENKDRFQESVRNMLKNESGFQRLMSVFLVRICGQIDLLPFESKMPKQGSIWIEYTDDAKTKFFIDCWCINFSDKCQAEEKKVFDDRLSSEDSSMFHEISHAYHYMLGLKTVLERNSHIYSWIFNFSALNSDELDLIDIYFPMFKPANMDPIIEELANIIAPYKKEIISMILQKKPPYGRIIVSDIITCGFGSILFKKVSEEKGLKYEDLLDNYLPEILYLSNFMRRYEEYDSVWTDGEEKITIQGNNIFPSNGRYFMIEDRHHEQIYALRRGNDGKICSNENVPIQECYRPHSLNLPKDTSTRYDELLAPLEKIRNQHLPNWLTTLFKWPLGRKLNRLLSDKKIWKPLKSNVKYKSGEKSGPLSEDDFINDGSFVPEYLYGKRSYASFDLGDPAQLLDYIENDIVDKTTINDLCGANGVLAEMVDHEKEVGIDIGRKILKRLVEQGVRIGVQAYSRSDFYEYIEPGLFTDDQIISYLRKYLDKIHDFGGNDVLFSGLKKINFENYSKKEEIDKIIENLKQGERDGCSITTFDMKDGLMLNIRKLRVLLPCCDVLDAEVAREIKAFLDQKNEKISIQMMFPLVCALDENERDMLMKNVKNFSTYEVCRIIPHMTKSEAMDVINEPSQNVQYSSLFGFIKAGEKHPLVIRYIMKKLENYSGRELFKIFSFLSQTDFSKLSRDDITGIEESVKKIFYNDRFGNVSTLHNVTNTDKLRFLLSFCNAIDIPEIKSVIFKYQNKIKKSVEKKVGEEIAIELDEALKTAVDEEEIKKIRMDKIEEKHRRIRLETNAEVGEKIKAGLSEYIASNNLEKFSTQFKILYSSIMSDEELIDFIEENANVLTPGDYVYMLMHSLSPRGTEVLDKIVNKCPCIAIKFISKYNDFDDPFKGKYAEKLLQKICITHSSDDNIADIFGKVQKMKNENNKRKLIDKIVDYCNSTGEIHSISAVLLEENLKSDVFFHYLNRVSYGAQLGDAIIKRIHYSQDIPFNAVFFAVKNGNMQFLETVLNELENKNLQEEQLTAFLADCLISTKLDQKKLKAVSDWLQTRVTNGSSLHRVSRFVLENVPVDFDEFKTLLGPCLFQRRDFVGAVSAISARFEDGKIPLEYAIKLYYFCYFYNEKYERSAMKMLIEKSGVSVENIDEEVNNLVDNDKVTAEEAEDFLDGVKHFTKC